MGNPPMRRPSDATCRNCTGYGGEAEYGDTICTRAADSGKTVSRMPESGCFAWVRRPVDQHPPAAPADAAPG